MVILIVPCVSDKMDGKYQSECKSVVKSFTLGQLPPCVLWQLLHYLDTNGIVALAGVNTNLRNMVMAVYNLSVNIPFTTKYANYLQKNPYDHNKPVLRLKINNICPDFIRLDKSLQFNSAQHIPVSHQVLLINMSTLTQVCLSLEQTAFKSIEVYRMAFLGMLQSIGLFKKLSKLHLTISQSALLILEPQQLGMRIVKDALKVDHLVITVMKDQNFGNLDLKIYTTV